MDKNKKTLRSIKKSSRRKFITKAAAATGAVDAIKVAAGQMCCVSLPNTVVSSLHAITSSGTVTCIVAALLQLLRRRQKSFGHSLLET